MKRRKAFMRALLGAALGLSGCAQTVKRMGYSKSQGEPPVCSVDFARPEDVPGRDSLPKLGAVRVRDALFTLDCTESDALDLIHAEACGLGANLAVVSKRRVPDLWLSSCFRAEADLLKAPDSIRAPLRAGFYAPDSVAERALKQERTQWTGIILGVVTGFVISALLIASGR
jgi:hypothetical protein